MIRSALEKSYWSVSVYAFFVYIAILFAQFQNLSVRWFGSAYDLTSFMFLIAIAVLLCTHKQKKGRYILFVLFIFAQLFLWLILQMAPFYRLTSGIIWFGGLLAISLFAYSGQYNKIFAFKLMNVSICFLAMHIVTQRLVFEEVRPAGFLDEPSSAGLLLFGWAVVILFKIFYEYNRQKKQLAYISYFFLLVVAALMTKSMHIITFILSVIMILYLLGLNRRLFIWGTLLLPLFAGIIIWQADLDHILDRMVITDNINNISLLSWLRGFDQAKQAILTSPFFGYGLGSTGFISFDSTYSDILAANSLELLNLTDAYSGGFRLVIELGLFSLLMIFYFILKYIRLIRLHNKNKIIDTGVLSGKYLAIFGLTLLIGVLLKEPSYSRSYVFLAVFFLATNRFKIYNMRGKASV